MEAEAELEAKLRAFDARKRREAAIGAVTTRLRKMIPLFHARPKPTDEPKSESPPVQIPAEVAAKVEAKPPKIADNRDRRKAPKGREESASEEEVLPFSDSSDDDEAIAAARKAKTAPAKRRDWLTWVIWLAYALFWCTCWAIAIELQFGLVFLLLSAIAGIYLNTRTGPRKRHEVSAYSVFNADCKAIDGTLNAEQFDREIRYGPANVR